MENDVTEITLELYDDKGDICEYYLVQKLGKKEYKIYFTINKGGKIYEFL